MSRPQTRPPKTRHTKAELEIIEDVRDDFLKAKTSRQNGCYWNTSKVGVEGGDWLKRWDVDEKADLQYCEESSRDEFSSNVKSPMITGRIDSTIHKLRRVNLRFAVYPVESDDPADKRKARIIQELMNQLFEKGDFKFRLITLFREALVMGTAFLQIYYLQRRRKVDLLASSADQLSGKQKKALAKQKRELEKGKREAIDRTYIPSEVIEYDDIALDVPKIQEIYVDPSARTLQGQGYEAQYIIRRMLPSIEQFKAIFEGDPDAKNISKVRAGSAYTNEDREFFEPPTDVYDKDYVELLHYYNKAKDRYVVLANDVLIKDMPLPYNHKQLPFIKVSPVEKPHQFYGIGIPDRLLALQGEEEILKNLVYDRLHITANPILKVKRTIYGEFSRAYQRAVPGTMLPVNQQEDVAPVDYPTMTFDMFRGIDLINRDAVIATQIDPSQMGLMQKYVSATTTMVNKEQTDMFINGTIESFSEGLATAGKQIFALMKQFYTKQKASEKISGKEEYRRVRLEGIEINPETFEVVQKNTDDYSFLEIKPEYFDINGDLDIRITPESMEVISKAVEMQKSQANLAQLAPFMIDPSDNQKRMAHPTPWVHGPRTLEWYMDTNSIPKELLLSVEEDEDISVKRAEDQGKRMLKGEDKPGIPGESDAHKAVHVKQLHVQNRKAEELEMQVNQAPMGPYASIYMQALPMTVQAKRERGIAQALAEHLRIDDTPRMLAEEEAVQKSQPPEVPMPPGLTPAAGAQPPMPAGGNQGAGMMGEPTMGGPGGQTGRPSLAELGLP